MLIHGSPLPSTIIPSRSLPIMPLSTRIVDKNTNDHPHPLRSHDIMAGQQNESLPRRPSPLIISRSGTHAERGGRPSLRTTGDGRHSIIDGLNQTEITSFSAPTHAAEEGLSHITGNSTPTTQDYPVIPVRSPLRPTISFAGVSKMSMYPHESSIYEKNDASVTVTSLDLEEESRCPVREAGRWRFYACFACLCLVNFMCDVSITAMAAVLPTVSKELGLMAVQTLWIPGSLLLSAAIMQPLFMRLPFALGCKSSLLFGLAIFTVGSILSGVSHNANILMIGRSLEGVGVGAITILTKLTLSQISSSSESHSRTMFEQAASQVFWLGIALGPVIGACFAQSLGWRSIFWMQVQLSLIGLISLALLLQLPYATTSSVWQRLIKIDYIGWLLSSASIISLVVATSWAGTTYSWTSYHTLLPLILGAIGLGLWCAYNRFWRIDNLVLPISIFHNGSAIIACFGSLVQGAVLMSLVYFLPLLFQTNTLQPTALLLAPWTFTLVVFSFIAAAFTRYTGYRSLIWAGWALIALSSGLMVFFNASTPGTFTIPVGILAGTGLGLLLPTLSTALSSAASKDDESIHAAPLHTFSSTLGYALGVIVSGSIFLNKLSLPQELQAQNIFSLIKDTLQSELINAIVSATKSLWIAACIVSGVVLFLSVWFLEDHMPQPRGVVELE